MGTRNLTMVQLDGECKVAQYGQWDGYPSGQGETILDWLIAWRRPEFEEKLRRLTFYEDHELKEIGEQFPRDWPNLFPHISRDMGAEILQYIMEKDGLKLKDSRDFAGDSLFCEWAYVLDLDANKLEVYRGFNTSPLSEGDRFLGLKTDGNEYYPIKLAASYSLDDLPTVAQMEKDCQRPDETEDEE